MIEGFVDKLEQGVIQGWAWTAEDPLLKVDIVALLDDVEVAKTKADLFRADLKQAGKSDGACAFRIRLPKDLHRLDRQLRLEVRAVIKDTLVPFSPWSFEGPASSADLRAIPEFKGYLDEIPSLKIGGWCALFPDHETCSKVTVQIDGETVYCRAADQFRGDLQKAGLGDGKLGFSLSVPSQFLDGKTHTVAAFATLDSGEIKPLTHSPRQITPRDVSMLESDLREVRRLSAAKRALRAVNISESLGQLHRLKRQGMVSIIVAIYNAHDQVAECIKSVLVHTKVPFELVCVNDCSPDSRIRELLMNYEGHSKVRVFHNEKNLGYTATVNRGIEVSTGDAVCLNSDTVVTPGWLERICRAAARSPDIGTVTPLSNSAGAFSAPVGEGGVDDLLSVEAVGAPLRASRMVARSGPPLHFEAPTGNGFCLFIRRELIDAIGVFDVATFGRGYGEENDLCMRAKKAGYRNVVVSDAYVLHHGSMSFQGEKLKRLEHANEQLGRLYPSYAAEVRRFVTEPALALAQERIADAFKNQSLAEKERVLIVSGPGDDTSGLDSDVSGDLEVWRFNLGKDQVELTSGANNAVLANWGLATPLAESEGGRSDVTALFSEVCQELAIDRVLVRRNGSVTAALEDAARRLWLTLEFTKAENC